MLQRGRARTAAFRGEGGETAALVRALPAPQRRASALSERERGSDALLARDAYEARAAADLAHRVGRTPRRRSAPARGQEPEPGALLVRMPEPTAVRLALVIARTEDSGIGHRRSSPLPSGEDTNDSMFDRLFIDVPETTGNVT
jgi:hypothetical protein